MSIHSKMYKSIMLSHVDYYEVIPFSLEVKNSYFGLSNKCSNCSVILLHTKAYSNACWNSIIIEVECPVISGWHS